MIDRLNQSAVETELLLRAGAGDQEAFAQFYDRVSGLLYSMALRMLDNQAEAQDALQAGMENLWRKAPKFDCTRASVLSWSVMLFRSRLTNRASA